MQQNRTAEYRVVKSADELKDHVKQIRSLETMSKDATLEMRLKHVG